jgi:succinate dehydrogenase/fumarate reductase flavoprotein subunit
MADVSNALSGLGLLNASSWGFAIMGLAAFVTLAILSDDDEPEGGVVSRPTQTRFPKEGRSSGGVCGAVEQRARRVTARIEASIDQGRKRARKNLQLARKNIDANIAQGKKRAQKVHQQLRERAEKVQQQTVKNLAELRERVEKVEGIGPVRNPLRARQFISEDGLGHLSRYAYKSGDYSFMDNLLNHFWVWSVEFLPLVRIEED